MFSIGQCYTIQQDGGKKDSFIYIWSVSSGDSLSAKLAQPWAMKVAGFKGVKLIVRSSTVGTHDDQIAIAMADAAKLVDSLNEVYTIVKDSGLTSDDFSYMNQYPLINLYSALSAKCLHCNGVA